MENPFWKIAKDTGNLCDCFCVSLYYVCVYVYIFIWIIVDAFFDRRKRYGMDNWPIVKQYSIKGVEGFDCHGRTRPWLFYF